MLAYATIAAAAFAASCLTLYSGFGLGTLLMPVFAIFLPVQNAVAATALVHGANNLLKLLILGKYADRDLVIRFGLPALAAAFAGAGVLGYTAHFSAVATYALGPHQAVITPLKLLMAAMMLIFALFEFLPQLSGLRVDRKYLVAGGILSGFFGGFSGHQGALRATFLTKMDLSTEAFVGTNAVIGFMVDAARLIIYGTVFLNLPVKDGVAAQWPLIATGAIAAFAGVGCGKYFLRKITMKVVKNITGALLLLIAAALGSGLI